MTAVSEQAPPRRLDVPLEDVEEHPGNPRHDVGDVDELAASIAALGVLQPIVVCPAGISFGLCPSCGYVHRLDDDGDLVGHKKGGRGSISCPGAGGRPSTVRPRYRLLAGHRRVAAARQAGLELIPAEVRADIADDGRQLAAMLAENLQRVNLTPVEEAEGYDQLKLFGWSQASIAEVTGRSKATVSARLRLAKLPEKTRARLHAHELTLDVAERLAEFADDPKLVAELERHAGTWNFDHSVQRARDDRRRAKERAKTEKALAAAGVTVVDQPKGWLHWGYAGPVRAVVDVVGPLVEYDADGDEVGEVDWEAAEKQAVDDHAGCPNHAAFLLTYRPDKPVYVCTDPTVHPDWEERRAAAAAAAGGGEQPAERAAREQRQAALRAELDAASTVRLDFVGQLLAGRSALQPLLLFRRTVADKVRGIYNVDTYGQLLDLLGIEQPSAKARRKEVALAHVEQCDLAGLGRVLLAVAAADLEHDRYQGTRCVEYDGQGVTSAQTFAPWLAFLEQQGYQPSDVDRRLATLPAADTPAPEPDEDDAGVPDDETEED